MNYIGRIKPNTLGLSAVALSSFLLLTGCGMGAKKNVDNVSSTTVIANKATPISQLSAPSFVYLLDTTKAHINRQLSAEDWLIMAKSNYESKRYARALRASNEALGLNDQLIEARQIAMLSAVKITQSNIGSYHDNNVMSSSDKARFKDTLTKMTTLVNASD